MIALAYVHPGHVTHGFMESVEQWRKFNPRNPKVAVSSGPNISRARNSVVAWFLDSSTADALFFVDTDMDFGPDVPDRLNFKKADVISASCVGLNEDGSVFAPSSVRSDDGTLRHLEPEELVGSKVKVVSGGTGAILIRREVLETLGHSPLMPFSDHDWGPPIGVTGHDVTFGLRVEKAGFSNWVAPDVEVGHIKGVTLYPPKDK